MFIASDFDVWSDGFLAYTYISGTTYDYNLQFLSDSEIEQLNCTVTPITNHTSLKTGYSRPTGTYGTPTNLHCCGG